MRRLSKDDSADRIRQHDFPHHQASLVEIDSPPMQVLHWQRPGTSICSIEYIFRGRRLIVTGDMGEAVYVWSSPVTPAFVASCELDYFYGKVKAVEGDKWDWDEAAAKAWLQDHWKDSPLNPETRAVHTEASIRRAASDRWEWQLFLDRHGYDVFGSDWWEFGGIGEVIPYRAQSHLIGLQMAWQQLQAKKEAKTA